MRFHVATPIKHFNISKQTKHRRFPRITHKTMGKPLSRFFTTAQQGPAIMRRELKEHLKGFLPGLKYKELLNDQSIEISKLSRQVENLHNEKELKEKQNTLSSQREEHYLYENKLLQEKNTKLQEQIHNLFDCQNKMLSQIEKLNEQIVNPQREEYFLNENKLLQNKNDKLLEQIHDLFEKENSKTKDDHSFQVNMAESQNKVLNQIEMLNDQITKPKSPNKIGEIGEDFVLECLMSAFPNNTSIVRTQGTNSGDILFRIDNTDKYIMFEVKNYAKSAISSTSKELVKFFKDLENNPNIAGGVLVSLNSPVDLNSAPLQPRFHNGKPYLYIDSLRLQYPDLEDLVMKVVVNLMTYLYKNCEQMEVKSYSLKVEIYLQQLKSSMEIYQKLYKNHETQRKNLDSLKLSLSNLNKILLDDKSAAEEENWRNEALKNKLVK